MMRRCAGFNTDEAWHQLLEECQDITSLQLAPDDHLAYRVDAVDLKNRLRDVETDRRDPVHAALLRIVVTPAATTSMALTCRWRSRPQHHNRTSIVSIRPVPGFAGYRYLEIQHSTGSFDFKINLQGPMVGVAFRF